MRATPIRLVCFDLGRVLVKICEGWPEACERAGVPLINPEDNGVREAMERAIHEMEVGAIEPTDFARRVADAVDGVEPDHVNAVTDVYLLGSFEGAIELVDDLHAAGLATACMSNTNARHWQLMLDDPAAYAAFHRLQHKVASHLARSRKPDEGIYAALETTVGVEPASILFFDDVDANIATARARGWAAEQIIHGGDPVAQMRKHLATHGVVRG